MSLGTSGAFCACLEMPKGDLHYHQKLKSSARMMKRADAAICRAMPPEVED